MTSYEFPSFTEVKSIRELRDQNRAIVRRLRTDAHDDESTLVQARRIGDPILLGESLATEAVRRFLLGDVVGAIDRNVEAKKFLDRLGPADSDPFFLWLVETTGGLTAESQGDTGVAREHFEAAATIGRSAMLIDLTARSLMSLGFLANCRSDPVAALGYYLELLHLPDLDASTTASTYMYLAVLFEDQRQWNLAMLYLSEGLTRAGQVAPDVEGAMRGLYGGLLARTGDFVGAEESLELAGRITVPGTIYAAQLEESRARFLFESGDLDEAERLARSAAALLLRQGAPSHVGKATVLLCEVLLKLGQPAALLAVVDGTDCSVLPIHQAHDLVLLEIQAHRDLEQFESASKAHDRFALLAEGNRLDAPAFYRLHRQLVDAHSLDAQHVALISRQVELTRLQDDLVRLVDQVANDLISPLTTLQLVFDSLEADQGRETVERRMPHAWGAVERMSLLADLFSAAQEEDENDFVDSARVAWPQGKSFAGP